ncbi:hypothetical protein X777_06904 [Ooceraea biroi]|uniref:Uncharacterized protein n=1 Tax=Ooceraea biroi TaxID=2015173 RepID=A0A026WF59_OOCBI|nr:hypothetical protein X777_06904 [Ooceraea biroi]
MNIRDQLHELYQSNCVATQFDIIALATSYYHIGIIYKDCEALKNLQLSLYNLTRSRDLLQGKELDCTAIIIVVKTVIAMSEIEEVPRRLNDAIKLCLQYIEQNNFPKPICTHLADVSTEEDLRILLISLYERMIECMKVFYDSDKAGEWINTVHEFLNKRTSIINSLTERCEWSSAVIVMSIHLLNNLRFTETRNCLAAVEYMIMLMERDNQSLDTIPNTVTELKARVADAWLTYTSQILWALSSYKQTNPLNQEELKELLLFTSLSEDLAYISNRITDSRVLNINDAKIVFSYGAEQYELASKHFVAMCNDAARLHAVYKLTLSFTYLASFATDTNTKVHIREQRKTLLYAICTDEHGYPLRLVSHLINILEVWSEALTTFFYALEGTRAFRILYRDLKRERRYVLNMIGYYNERIANGT